MLFSELPSVPKCVPTKGKDDINVYSAMKGYDIVKGNPLDSMDDPGIAGRIFYQDCGDGFFDFILEVTDDLRCDSDFSAKIISSMDEYDRERTSSNTFSASGSVSVEGEAFGISASASASYTRSTDSDEQASESILTKHNGEIIIAKATCLTHSVSISHYVRPVFTSDFILGLKALDNAAKSNDIKVKEEAVATFIREFGTHYSKTTQLGSELVYERRFDSKEESGTMRMHRAGCVKQEAAASVTVTGSVAGGSADFSMDKADCSDETQGSQYAASEGFESTRTVSRGSRPKDLNSWVDADFTPVPIKRTLTPISELFKDEWLESNPNYGFDVTLSGSNMKVMFDAAAKKYCQIMMPGILDDNCEVIGKNFKNWKSKFSYDCEIIFHIFSIIRLICLLIFTVCKNSGLDCKNGGECINRAGQPACSCTAQFSGENCELMRG